MSTSETTEYGYRRLGTMPFVFVVPHGGDPAERGVVEVADHLRRLDVSLIVNTGVRRRVADLNRTPEDGSLASPLWLGFFRDVLGAVTAASDRTGEGPTLVLSLHNAMPQLTDKSFLFPRRDPRTGEIERTPVAAGGLRPWDVDIGAGYSGLTSPARMPTEELERSAEVFCNDLLPAEALCPERGMGGALTCSCSMLFQMVLASRRMMPGWRVEVGINYPAQNPHNLVQALYARFKDRGRFSAVQLEFREELAVLDVAAYLEHLVLHAKEWD